MFFLPVICVVLGIGFVVAGRRQDEERMRIFGYCLFIVAFATAMISYLAVSTLN